MSASGHLRRRNLPFWLLASAILLITVGAVSHALSQQREKAAEVLHAIAELKALQIADWLKERQGNAEFVKSSQFLVHTWPLPSHSGEILLLRRDGSQVKLPGDSRPDGAEALHLPRASEILLTAQAVQGKANAETLLEMRDQRGAAVLGAVHAIPGSEWLLLAKMDKAEVYGHARQDALWIALAGFLALGMAAAGAYLMRQRQQLALAAEVQRSQTERLHTLSLMAALAESSDDAIFAKDMDCRFILFNQAAARFVGKPASEVLGQDARALFPAEQAESLLAVDRQVLAESRFFTREEVLATRKGERIFHSTKGPLRDAQGQVIGIFGISRDITEHRQAEVALRRQAAELQSRNDELERFNRAVVGRELSMIELKQQVNALSRRLGEAPPYPLNFLDKPAEGTA